MRNKSFAILLLALLFIGACTQNKDVSQQEKLVNHLKNQLSFALNQIEPLLKNENELVAPRTIEEGALRMVSSSD